MNVKAYYSIEIYTNGNDMQNMTKFVIIIKLYFDKFKGIKFLSGFFSSQLNQLSGIHCNFTLVVCNMLIYNNDLKILLKPTLKKMY